MLKTILAVAGRTLGLIALYYAALLAVVVLRFGQLPDFAKLHSWWTNVMVLINHTPTLGLALKLAAREPLVEVGRMLPDLPAVEWSVSVVPLKFLAVAVTALALVLWRRRAVACRVPPGASVLTGGGAAVTAFASATVGWIACCAFPNWTVLVAMGGLWIPTAMELEPWGAVMIAAGLALLTVGHVLNRRVSV